MKTRIETGKLNLNLVWRDNAVEFVKNFSKPLIKGGIIDWESFPFVTYAGRCEIEDLLGLVIRCAFPHGERWVFTSFVVTEIAETVDGVFKIVMPSRDPYTIDGDIVIVNIQNAEATEEDKAQGMPDRFIFITTALEHVSDEGGSGGGK